MKFLYLSLNLIFTTFIATSGHAAIQEMPLKNGAFIIGEQDKNLPRNHLRLTFQGGASRLSPENQGVAKVLALALDEGPYSMSAEKYKEKLFRLGATVSASVSSLSFTLHVVSLPETQREVLKLVAEMIAKPRVDKPEFRNLHAKQLANAQGEFESMRTVISYVAVRHMYAYASQVMNGNSSPATFQKLGYKVFKREYKKLLDPSRLVVGFVGPDSLESTKTLVEEVLADQFKTKSKFETLPPAPMSNVKGTSYVLIEKAGATDNQLLFMYPQFVSRDGPQWMEARIVQDILGNGSSGKLGETLRTERGLTYGARSWFSEQLPNWQVWTFGGVEQTKGLLSGVPEVVAKFQSAAISQESLDQAKSKILISHKTDFELAGERLEETMWFRLNGLNIKAFENFETDLRSTKLAGVNAFRKKLETKNVVVYLMGDKTKTLATLNGLGVDTTKVQVIAENSFR